MADIVEELIARRKQDADAREALRAALRSEAQRAEQPLRHVDPNFKHKALVATARNDNGMRRSGVFVGPEKTLIPSGTFRSQEAYDAFVNEPGLVVMDAPSSKAELEGLATIEPSGETETEDVPKPNKASKKASKKKEK